MITVTLSASQVNLLLGLLTVEWHRINGLGDTMRLPDSLVDQLIRIAAVKSSLESAEGVQSRGGVNG